MVDVLLAIIGTVATLVFGSFGIWSWFRARSRAKLKEMRRYFAFGATLAKLGYRKVLNAGADEAVETLKLVLVESGRKLDLSNELRVQLHDFIQVPKPKGDQLADLRNRITHALNVTVNPHAATAFYLGVNVINLLMLAQLGTTAPSAAHQTVAVIPMRVVLSEVLRDSKRLNIPTRRLRRLTKISTQPPSKYFAKVSATVNKFVDNCDEIMGKSE